MDDLTVQVEAEINPTESEQKVRQAVENMFGPINMRLKPLQRGSVLQAEAKGLEALSKLRIILQRERIRAAARTVLLGGTYRRTINFCLNKQVAFVGHVSFSQEEAESPLGPIRVKIDCDTPREVIHWLTAQT